MTRLKHTQGKRKGTETKKGGGTLNHRRSKTIQKTFHPRPFQREDLKDGTLRWTTLRGYSPPRYLTLVTVQETLGKKKKKFK